MKLTYINKATKGELHYISGEPDFDRLFYTRDRRHKFLTIAWNKGPAQKVIIDEITYNFPSQHILALMVNQSFRFERPEEITAWQYNRDFYCIIDHDKEVSCVGFLYYGSAGIMFIRLDDALQQKLTALEQVFADEFAAADTIQHEMLQMLLKRLIIIITRLAKEQYTDEHLTQDKLDIVRKYNLLVENNYRKEHQVQFYATQLNKSPKTLTNQFALYNQKSPLAVIQYRIILEAKRLLIYTEKSVKEIAYELGFDDAAYFSNLFKKCTDLAPSEFRHNKDAFFSGQ